VCFDINKPPEQGRTWNVWGKDAEKVMHEWPHISERVRVPHTNEAVANINRGFKVLFTWDYITAEEIAERDWFNANFKECVDKFATLIANKADPNYFHEFKYHAHPGLLKYSNDVQETVNCKVKYFTDSHREEANTPNTGH
jgi:hypothetical protein